MILINLLCLRAVLNIVTYNILFECQEHVGKQDQEISVHDGINRSITKALVHVYQPKGSPGILTSQYDMILPSP